MYITTDTFYKVSENKCWYIFSKYHFYSSMCMYILYMIISDQVQKFVCHNKGQTYLKKNKSK